MPADISSRCWNCCSIRTFFAIALGILVAVQLTFLLSPKVRLEEGGGYFQSSLVGEYRELAQKMGLLRDALAQLRDRVENFHETDKKANIADHGTGTSSIGSEIPLSASVSHEIPSAVSQMVPVHTSPPQQHAGVASTAIDDSKTVVRPSIETNQPVVASLPVTKGIVDDFSDLHWPKLLPLSGVSRHAVIFTMDSIPSYEQDSKRGGAAGELLVRHSLTASLRDCGVKVTTC